MNSEDKFKTNKSLYDHSIEFDITSLPEFLINEIRELEKYDLDGDWFNYDIKFDELEIDAKSYLRNRRITEEEYNKILEKYGGLYD